MAGSITASDTTMEARDTDWSSGSVAVVGRILCNAGWRDLEGDALYKLFISLSREQRMNVTINLAVFKLQDAG